MAKKKSNKIIKRIYNIFMVVFVGIVFTYVISCYNTYLNLENQEKSITLSIQEEQKKNVLLKSELEMNQTDAYIEKVAREKLGYLKYNEIIYINRSK